MLSKIFKRDERIADAALRPVEKHAVFTRHHNISGVAVDVAERVREAKTLKQGKRFLKSLAKRNEFRLHERRWRWLFLRGHEFGHAGKKGINAVRKLGEPQVFALSFQEFRSLANGRNLEFRKFFGHSLPAGKLRDFIEWGSRSFCGQPSIPGGMDTQYPGDKLWKKPGEKHGDRQFMAVRLSGGLEPKSAIIRFQADEAKGWARVQLPELARYLDTQRTDLLLNPLEKFPQPAGPREWSKFFATCVGIKLRQGFPDGSGFFRDTEASGCGTRHPVSSSCGLAVLRH